MLDVVGWKFWVGVLEKCLEVVTRAKLLVVVVWRGENWVFDIRRPGSDVDIRRGVLVKDVRNAAVRAGVYMLGLCQQCQMNNGEDSKLRRRVGSGICRVFANCGRDEG